MNAWECPRCGCVNAPTATQCTCKPATAFLPAQPVPRRGTPGDSPLWPKPYEIPTPKVTYSTGGAINAVGRVSPPDCPTSLGDVWVGVTQPIFADYTLEPDEVKL